MKTFTIEQAKEVQTSQLNDWQRLLKPKVFLSLKKHLETLNLEAKQGYDIARGNTIDNLIFNVILKQF